MQRYLTKSRRILITAVLVCAGVIAITQISTRHIFSQANDQKITDEKEVPTQDDPWRELEGIVANYYAEGGILYEGTVKVIDASGEEEKVLEELPMMYTMLDEAFHYRMGSNEMISKNELLLAIDHRGKTITYLPRSFSAGGNQQLFDPGRFKALLEQQEAQAAVSQAGELKILTIDGIQDPSIQGYRIYYRPDNFRVQKMEIGMNRWTPLDEEDIQEEGEEAPASSESEGLEIYTYFLEVHYARVQKLGLQREAFRPEEKFIQIQPDSIQLTPSFKGYTFFNEGE
jgi:hypothetical protein